MLHVWHIYLHLSWKFTKCIGEYAMHRASGACNRIQKISEKCFLCQRKICLAISSIDSIEFPLQKPWIRSPKGGGKIQVFSWRKVFLCQFPIPLKSLLLLISKTFLRKPGISGPNGIRKKKQEMDILESWKKHGWMVLVLGKRRRFGAGGFLKSLRNREFQSAHLSSGWSTNEVQQVWHCDESWWCLHGTLWQAVALSNRIYASGLMVRGLRQLGQGSTLALNVVCF